MPYARLSSDWKKNIKPTSYYTEPKEEVAPTPQPAQPAKTGLISRMVSGAKNLYGKAKQIETKYEPIKRAMLAPMIPIPLQKPIESAGKAIIGEGTKLMRGIAETATAPAASRINIETNKQIQQSQDEINKTILDRIKKEKDPQKKLKLINIAKKYQPSELIDVGKEITTATEQLKKPAETLFPFIKEAYPERIKQREETRKKTISLLKQGKIKEAIKTELPEQVKLAGTGLEIASFVAPEAKGLKAMTPLARAGMRSVTGGLGFGGYMGGEALREEKPAGEVAKETGKGILTGMIVNPLLGGAGDILRAKPKIKPELPAVVKTGEKIITPKIETTPEIDKYLESKGTKFRERIYLRDELERYAGSEVMPPIYDEHLGTLKDWQSMEKGKYHPSIEKSYELTNDMKALTKRYGINIKNKTPKEISDNINKFIEKNKKGIVPFESPDKVLGDVENIPINKLNPIEGDREIAAKDFGTSESTKTNLPVLARKETDGSITILDGNGRILKAQSEGKTSIPVTFNESEYRKLTEETKFRLKDDFQKNTGITISDQQEKRITEFNKKIFGDEDVKITAQILTPKGQEALGSYKNGIIRVVDGRGNVDDTFYHESVHKALDLFTTRDEHAGLLQAGMDKYGISDLGKVEERLSEDFINYAKNREGITGQLKIGFDKVINRVKSYFGNEDTIKSFYTELASGEKNILKGGEVKTTAKVAIPKPEITKVPGEQLPVGAGKEKVSRLETRIKGILGKVSEEDKTKLSTYNQMNKESQIKNASKYVSENPDEALKVLEGKQEPPEGILHNSIALAMQEKAVADADADLALKLASLRSTRAGQEISILTEVDKNNPVRHIDDLIQRRIEAKGGEEKIKTARVKTTEEVKNIIKKSAPTRQNWTEFISSLRC
jgi:hypothetical protein